MIENFLNIKLKTLYSKLINTALKAIAFKPNSCAPEIKLMAKSDQIRRNY